MAYVSLLIALGYLLCNNASASVTRMLLARHLLSGQVYDNPGKVLDSVFETSDALGLSDK